MELDSLLNTLETLGRFGNVISTEESLILHNSLLLLQNENHFRKIYFWGRIFGTDRDYYVAYGYVKDALEGKIFYYSKNGVDWGLLPLPTENGKKLTPLCTTKFQGDPAILIDLLLEKDEIAFGKPLKKPEVRKLKEEDRLSATIHFINEEATLIPRGGFFKRPDGVVVENLSFEGLDYLDSIELRPFQHNRRPHYKWNTNLLTREDYNYALDFLDTLDTDVPDGCWVTQTCNGETIAVLESLYWPGYFFYHYIKTPRYGSVYFGHGKRDLDIPFMLHSM
ncbi:radial spoke head protein 9 homolog [Agrilus planipennis]|uniref:Radial spoke head protein 9 homolog n=1 Tax=Agrilus planipennis TaxID=224129 RepID=A0A1W4X1F1_AGRPL|nr:radial spoke head protein 9 homolog [Agrilus planipennis]